MRSCTQELPCLVPSSVSSDFLVAITFTKITASAASLLQLSTKSSVLAETGIDATATLLATLLSDSADARFRISSWSRFYEVFPAFPEEESSGTRRCISRAGRSTTQYFWNQTVCPLACPSSIRNCFCHGTVFSWVFPSLVIILSHVHALVQQLAQLHSGSTGYARCSLSLVFPYLVPDFPNLHKSFAEQGNQNLRPSGVAAPFQKLQQERNSESAKFDFGCRG